MITGMYEQINIMEEEEKKLTGRGGAGRGQGRKSKSDGGTRHMGFRCSQDVYEILKMQPDKTAYIEAAIREKHKRERDPIPNPFRRY